MTARKQEVVDQGALMAAVLFRYRKLAARRFTAWSEMVKSKRLIFESEAQAWESFKQWATGPREGAGDER